VPGVPVAQVGGQFALRTFYGRDPVGRWQQVSDSSPFGSDMMVMIRRIFSDPEVLREFTAFLDSEFAGESLRYCR
jgi:hypothetical protein